MPGTHTASKCVATCNLVIKKAVPKETAVCPEHTPQARRSGVDSCYKKSSLFTRLHMPGTHVASKCVATCNLVTKKSGSVKNRYVPGTRLELAHP